MVVNTLFKYRNRLTAIITIAVVLWTALFYATEASAMEQHRVTIEAVGFFSHFPLKQTRNVIEEVCAKFGNRVQLTLYDETSVEGRTFMSTKGLSGHIPMKLYINGNNTFSIDGKEVSFSDFVGDQWTEKDLEKVISMTLEGLDISAAKAKAGGNGSIKIAASGGIAATILFIGLCRLKFRKT